MPGFERHTPGEDHARRRHAATRIITRLQDEGHIAYWAGGCVRDMLLGSLPRDYDIATGAPPEAVLACFPHAVAVGKSFGVMMVSCDGFHFETATFRQDHDYQDGRHPGAVTFATPQEDAKRRDFTINAMFYDPVGDRLHDFVNGRADLAARCIRCVGDPGQRFAEDHLRLLRAVRFAATLAFTIEPATAAAIRHHANDLMRISTERIRDEFTRTLLEARQPGAALRMLEDFGLLPVFLPEVSALQHQDQPRAFHPEGDVFNHTAMMLDRMELRDPVLAYAVLLHDIAKPATAFHDGQRIRFNGHAEEGARMAESILRRMRLPNRIIEAVAACVHGHMRFMEVKKMRRATLRRMTGRPTFELELELHRLDCLASHAMLDNHAFASRARDAFADEPALPPPWINGRDLIALGISPGPRIGAWLQAAYNIQLDGRHSDREALLRWLKAQPLQDLPPPPAAPLADA